MMINKKGSNKYNTKNKKQKGKRLDLTTELKSKTNTPKCQNINITCYNKVETIQKL